MAFPSALPRGVYHGHAADGGPEPSPSPAQDVYLCIHASECLPYRVCGMTMVDPGIDGDDMVGHHSSRSAAPVQSRQ